MTTEIAAASRSPFESLKHTDSQGDYWLAREMWQPAGYSEWRQFDLLVQRALTVLTEKWGEETADQHIFGVFPKITERKKPGRPQSGDYRLTRYGAYMVLSRSDKPELADYFVVQTMFAENVQANTPQQSVASVLAAHADQLHRIGFHPDGSVRYVEFKREQPKAIAAPVLPNPTQVLQMFDQILEHDAAAEHHNDAMFDRDYGSPGETWLPTVREKLRKVLGFQS